MKLSDFLLGPLQTMPKRKPKRDLTGLWLALIVLAGLVWGGWLDNKQTEFRESRGWVTVSR